VPVDNLRQGDNVVAVEVHQTNPGSSDIVHGMSADVIEVKRESYTPVTPIRCGRPSNRSQPSGSTRSCPTTSAASRIRR